MKKFVGFFLVIHCVSPYFIENEILPKDKIMGGYYDTIEKVSYVAQILKYGGVLICGGAIISESWILTAAHCIKWWGLLSLGNNDILVIQGDNLQIKTHINQRKADLTVMVGSSIRSFGDEEYEIKQKIPHPGYNPKTSENDIALIELTKEIKLNLRQWPISITNKRPEAGQTIKVSGFGKESRSTGRSPMVKSMKVPIIDIKECREIYKKKKYVITKNMFCARADISDAATGDSGGPAVINNRLVGIVAFGTEEESLYQFPGVYTNVYYFRDWIKKESGISDHYSLDRAFNTLSVRSPNSLDKEESGNQFRYIKSEPGSPYKGGNEVSS